MRRIDHTEPTKLEAKISAAILMGAAFAMQAEARESVEKGIPHGDVQAMMRVNLLLDLADAMAKTSKALSAGV